MVGTVLCTGMMENRLKMHIVIEGFGLIVFLSVVYPKRRYVDCEKVCRLCLKASAIKTSNKQGQPLDENLHSS